MKTKWDKIPHHPLGKMPDELYDRNPLLARACIAKRALVAGYEVPDCGASVTDLLSDLHHLCNRCGIDFRKCMAQAEDAYAEEMHKALLAKTRRKKAGKKFPKRCIARSVCETLGLDLD